MVSLLLRWRPELAINLDNDNNSPLHFASSDGDCSIVQEILAHAPPSIPYLTDKNGVSALHVASLMGNSPVVRLLLQLYPASSDIRDNCGRNFLHVAAMRGHSSIVSHVIKNPTLKHLLNRQDREGNTALHLAVEAGEYKVISKLLSCGKVHAHIMNNVGHTPSDMIENSTGFLSMVSHTNFLCPNETIAFSSFCSACIVNNYVAKLNIYSGSYCMLFTHNCERAGKLSGEVICIWSTIQATETRPYKEMDWSGYRQMASGNIKEPRNCFHPCGHCCLFSSIQRARFIWT